MTATIEIEPPRRSPRAEKIEIPDAGEFTDPAKPTKTIGQQAFSFYFGTVKFTAKAIIGAVCGLILGTMIVFIFGALGGN